MGRPLMRSRRDMRRLCLGRSRPGPQLLSQAAFSPGWAGLGSGTGG